jgi:hypothetical protein
MCPCSNEKSFQEGQAAQPKLVAAINASTPDSRL